MQNIWTFTSQLPVTLAADRCYSVLPPSRYVLLSKSGTTWTIKELEGGLALGGATVSKVFIGVVRKLLTSPVLLGNYSQVVLGKVLDMQSTPAGLGEGVTITRTSSLQIKNTDFLAEGGGKVFVPIFIANSTGYIYTEDAPVTFLGETWNRTIVKCRSSPLSLPFETNSKYFGAGMVEGSYPLVLAGETGAVLTTNKWAVAQASDIGGIIKSFAPAGTTWVLANFKFWNDEEPPTFAKVISDATSGEIYRFVLPPTPQPELQFSFTIKANQKVRVFRYRSTATIPTAVEDGGVTPLQLGATPDNSWQWVGYTPITPTVTFHFGGNGMIDIDIASLKSNYYPNYQRVKDLLDSLPAFETLVPNFSALPQEEYLAYLNGNLSTLQASISRGQYITRNLRRENVILTFKLSPHCIPTAFIKVAMREIASGLSPIAVFQQGNKVYAILVCATTSSEALILSQLHALRDTIQNLFKDIVDGWDETTIEIIPLHRFHMSW